ncbi:hypothetical protein L1049_012949 [Liquidambar formosana]|uniref:Uncharacterized protein n=1 Tax=Liquidambar formosana TaxID=63359 RepID=A0AAP0RKC7_LIQFO
MERENIYQLFVKLLDGKTLTLRFASPTVSGKTLTQHLYEITHIPSHHQLLLSQGRNVYSESLVSADENHLFPTVHLLLRLIGGKGGFGSLLRGAATKAGQKKTNNFDACRDMSGRRLRHVNAEKRLEEWRAEEEERRLEKVAEEYLKKTAKAARKAGGSGKEDKYVEKYREDSARCVAEVETAVREAIRAGDAKAKRKAAGNVGSDAKKFKIWSGKKKLEESDSDDMDEDGIEDDDDEENAKSVVIDNENQSDSNKEADGSSSSVSDGKLDGESSGGVSCESGSEEEKEIVVQGTGGSKGVDFGEGNGVAEPQIHEEQVVQISSQSSLGAEMVLGFLENVAENQHADKLESEDMKEVVGQPPSISNSEERGDFESKTVNHEGNGFSESKSGIHAETVIANTNISDLEKPLNFEEFSSAAEMEVLGMERLKSELQTRGLKCGGTLQERAARLFLLKTTPLEMLPKKLLAKK